MDPTDAPAPEGAPAPSDNTPVAEPVSDGLPANDPNGEGVTAEEIAKATGYPIAAPVAAATDEDEDEETPEDPVPPADDPSNPNPAETPPAEVPPLPPNPDDPNKPEPLQPEKPVAPTPENPAEDPNRPADLEVQDANGVTYKIASIEDLPEDFEPENNRQIMQIIRDTDQLAADRKAYDDARASDAETAARDDQIAAIQQGWNSEIEQLKADKRIDTDPSKSQTRVDAVYAHMGEENAKRIEAGRPTISSFEDALNSLERSEAQSKAADDKLQRKDESRKNGALVGGASTPATATEPAYRPGSARTAIDAVRSMNLIK